VHQTDPRWLIGNHRRMSRLPRLVVPGLPHHVTQRGNSRAQAFFSAAKYALYQELLADACRAADVATAATASAAKPNCAPKALLVFDGTM